MGSELGMEFGAPEHLVWIWVVPPAMIVLWLSEKRRRQRLKMVGALEADRAGAFGGTGRTLALSGFRTFLKMTMLGLGLTSLVLALAKPRWGFEWIDAKQRGADIMIAVDVSKSMLAPDVSPSRLERARRKVSDLLDRMSGDRVGLVAFAGSAFVQCPLTMDYGAVRLFLSYLDPELIPTQGTDLGAAIDMSMAGLFDGAPEGATTGRAIIIMTDGEDQEGRGQRAAAAAKEKGVKIYTIGIGSEEGTLIPEPDGGFLKDRSGNLVVSKPNEGALKAVAEASGGSYVRSVAGDGDIKYIYDRGILNDINREELQEVRTKKWHERFQWFLAAAFFFLFAEPLVRDVRGLKAKGKVVVPLLVLLAGIWPQNRAEAASLGDAHEHYKNKEYEAAAKEFAEVEQERPDDPEVTYNRAVSQYRSGDFKGAAEGFGRAAGAKDPALQERSWYNMGNALAYQQKFEDAAKSYENALKLNPENKKAKENLELVKKMLEQQKQQEQQSQDQQQKDDQEQNQDQQQQQSQDQQQKNDQAQDQQEQQNQDQDQTGEEKEQQSSDQPQQSEEQKQQEQQEQQQGKGEEKKEEQQAAGQEEQQQHNEQEANNHNQKDQKQEQTAQQQYSKDQALQLLRSVQDQIKKYRYMDQSGQDQRQDPEKNW